MRPPWIIFNLFLILLIIITKASGNDKAQGEDENSTVLRMQREINERERRLIPYMTYYVTQSLTNPTSGTRQNVFVPIASPRENAFRFDGIPKFSENNPESLNLQYYSEVLSKPVTRIQNPLLLTTSAIQTGQQQAQYKTRGEIGILPQVYRLQAATLQPKIHSQAQSQQIQSETQPFQVVKINQVPVEQKLSEPQLIKIIPVITKPSSTYQSPKPIISQQPQYTYTNAKLQTLVPNAYAINAQNYYKNPMATTDQNSFQGNKIYGAHVPQEHPSVRIVGQTLTPEKNKYTIAKVFLSSTTSSPYLARIKLKEDDARGTKVVNNLGSVEVNQLRHINLEAPGYTQESALNIGNNFSNEKYTAITANQPEQIYYDKETADEKQSNIKGQSLQPFIHNLGPAPRLRVPEEENIRFVATVTPVPITNDLGNAPPVMKYDEDKKVKTVNIYDKASLDNILSILKETSNLPQNLTPENIDSGIKTLALILERLQQQKNYQQIKKPEATLGSSTSEPQTVVNKEEHNDHKKVHSFPQRSGTSTPGRPGVDYPIYSSIPQTSFDCSTQRYKGFFGDPDTNCQVWHYCDLNGGQASFLCPNGTIFSQVALTCDWWFNVKCASTSQLYVLNERLYKYILPFSPSFPEDYSGPIVDTYLAAKFKEMEAKSKIKALKALTTTTTTTTSKPDFTTYPSSDEQTEAIEYRTISKEV